MTLRFIGYVIVLASILVLPYWIYIPVLLIAMIFFPFFWEGILFAFLIEVIHGSGIEAITSFVSPAALSAVIVLIILLPVRESLRYYV